MYPLKFKNLYFEKVWGSQDLKKIRNNVPEGKIGESWDVSCHPNGMSIINNGKYKGIKLGELIEKIGSSLLGTKISKDKFPLLVKILNTSENLSVQVHPDDEYAAKNEGEMGKTEVWYVMDAKEGSYIILGTKDCTKKEFEKAIKTGEVERYMNKIEVKKGEVYYLKSGLIHTMGSGLIIAEIQQNSDTTYRVYDYGRDREIHIDKALDVIDFGIEGEKRKGLKIEKDNYNKTYYCLNEHFSLEVYSLEYSFEEYSDEERFFIFTCVEGSGTIKYDGGEEEIELGDSVFIPAKLGKYEISGKCKLIKSYVPCINKVENEILKTIK